jgi:hypothetical protein
MGADLLAIGLGVTQAPLPTFWLSIACPSRLTGLHKTIGLMLTVLLIIWQDASLQQ